MYHKVLAADRANVYPLANLVITELAFDRQMRWLARHARVMTVAEAMVERKYGLATDRPTVCVSFDDGYRDNAERAAPILAKYGLRATFFVTTGFVEGQPLWFDLAAWAWRQRGPRELAASMGDTEPITDVNRWIGQLKQLDEHARRQRVLMACAGLDAEMPTDVFSAMSVEQLRQLQGAGHEIASHTVTHPILTRLDDTALRHELHSSRRSLTDWLGSGPEGLSYPNGDYGQRVTAAAAEVGYAYACTVQRGLNRSDDDAYRLKRRMISPDTASTADGFAAETLGLHDYLRKMRVSV